MSTRDIEDSYFVYMMTNRPRGVLYVGMTSNLVGRVWQHRTHYYKGCFTDRYNLERLVWAQCYREVGFAIKREKLIKRWVRPWKYALVEAENPDWDDLWEGITSMKPFKKPSFDSYNLDAPS